MSLRWRVLASGSLVIVLLSLGGLAYRGSRTVHAVAAVSDIPEAVQESALAALGASGYEVQGSPVWAGARPAWRTPGQYRLFFAATPPEGGTDVFSAEARVDGQGQLAGLMQAARLTRTPAGDETAPVLGDNWLAFATRVADLYQSITCVPLEQTQRLDVFAFDEPVGQVDLSWQSQPGRGPILAVTVGEGDSATHLTVDPESRRVEPDGAGLRYLPVTRGEMSWLPNLVSRVRELPGVGPEKIAFLENVFFTLTDRVTRLLHSRDLVAPTASVPSPTAAAATTTATSPATTATAAPTEQPTATATSQPTPEGQRLADGIVWRGTVKPDAQRPYADVEVVEIDPTLLQIKMVPGTVEPKPTTGLIGSGIIPVEEWPQLVAGFNGGFAAMHGQYGMMVDRKVYLPARDGVATLAVYEDGSIRIGTWGRDLKQTPDMVSYRQNCPPLIENGTITAETGKLTLWGLSVANEVYLYRSGLGVTRDGRLVYVAGKPLSAYTLARALQMAGAVYAMQLDVDEFHVAFITYNVQPGQEGSPPVVNGQKLRNDMRGFDGLFLRPFQLDFFYLLRRPQPLAQAVRMALTPVATQPAVPVLSQELPGQIAFASHRDGNWELYSMKPGRPDTVRRLTNNPADDLYPAWSSDGRKLAFASRRDGNSEIYILDLASGQVSRVTHQPSEEWAPAWAPDGKHLAYQSDRNGQSDIYVCALDGSGETRLTPMEGNHEAPDWSPDGQRFVFDSDLDVGLPVHASINLYTMGADGSNPQRFLTSGESPRWSPDGSKVAFTSRRSGFWQVYVVLADGSGLRQATKGNFDTRYPSWSPDGQWLAFATYQEGRWELYAMPANGGETQRLMAGGADGTYPVWGP